MLHRPGKKLFKGRIIHPTTHRVVHYVVWDGVRDYENEPSQELIALLANAAGPDGTVGIVQIRNHKAGRKLIEFLNGPFDHFIIWARDHHTYRAIVDNLEAQSDAWIQ
jgi:hypothetical protein